MNLRREAIHSEDYWEFQPGEHVMTVDGYPGVITLVEDGPMAGAENYVVTLDKGLGGGNYSASMLAKMPTGRSAAGIHLATDDYPELGTVIDDRPDPGKMIFSAALSQERQEADAEDHDEPDGDDQPHSCSYCGGTDFTDLTDNGRVRQATCGTCGGTMSAHPGMQWTPELIGDPSNHPKMTVDPRSGASPGAGSPGQAGINDFIDFDSRVSTTAAADPEGDTGTIPTKRVGFTGYIEGEKTNFPNHGDNPDWEDEQAVGQHTGVHEFRGYSGRENDFAPWHDKGEIGPVPLHGTKIYATQPRVTQRGISTYLNDPGHRSGSGRPNYPANERPMFVKHQGDYYTLDGHHRTGAAMLRGDEHIEGHVYDADKHGFPPPEWSPFSKRLPRSLEKYSALAGAYLGCGFDTDDESEALRHELAHHDDGFCSAPRHQKMARNWAFQHQEQETGGTKRHTAAHAAEHGISHVYRGVHGPDAAAAAAAHRAGELGSGMHGRGIYTTSSPDLATSYAQAYNGDRTGVFMHGQIHPDASVTHLDDVPKHVPLGTATDWAREQGHDVLSDGGNTHIVVNPHAVTWDPKNYDIGEAYKKFNKWGEDYHGGPEDLLGHHTAAVDGPDWCTWRRTARCTFPGDITTDGHVLGIPQDRGPCPWETRWQQQVCPISEPGPGAAMERKGSVNRTQLKIAGVPSLPERVVSSATTAALEARVASDDEDDYRMQHQTPDADYGAPLHDVTKHMPDFYEHPEYYNHGQDHFHDSAAVIRSARDQPEKMIHIYRALPAEHAHKGIRPGDWVSTSKEYARGEGRMSDPKDDYPVIHARVPAKHLHTEGDVHEWGYNGPDTVHGTVVYKGGYNQEVRHNAEGLIKQVQRRPKKEAAETSGAMARLAAQMAKALGPGSANR